MIFLVHIWVVATNSTCTLTELPVFVLGDGKSIVDGRQHTSIVRGLQAQQKLLNAVFDVSDHDLRRIRYGAGGEPGQGLRRYLEQGRPCRRLQLKLLPLPLLSTARTTSLPVTGQGTDDRVVRLLHPTPVFLAESYPQMW